MSERTTITAKGPLFACSVHALWSHRHVLAHLVQKDILVRFKHMLLGALWVLLQPLLEVLAFTLVFRGVFAGETTLPYPIFVFAGVLLWTYFASTVSRTAGCIVGHSNLVKRLAFPRIMLPLSVVCSRFLDFLIMFTAFIALLLYYGVPLSLTLLWSIPLMFLLMCAMIGISTLLATLHVYYRDVGLVVPYVLRIGMVLTPVFYPLSILPEKWHLLIALNPLTGIIDAFRTIVSGQTLVLTPLLQTSILVTAVLLLVGIIIFRSKEGTFLDQL